jgi:hypothetical protein
VTVAELWRYPVKSMGGERLESIHFTATGGEGDRGLALIDRTSGRIGSAKLPRRWGTLLGCSARRLPDGRVAVTLPGGEVVTGPGPELDRAIAALIGADVTIGAAVPDDATIDRYWPDIDGLAMRDTETSGPIAGAAPGTFFDHAPVHLVTTSALASVGACDGTAADPRRFRPNLVIDSGSEADAFPENAWVGRTLAIGEAELTIIARSPRCVVTTLAQPGVPADLGLLRAVARDNTVPFAEPGSTRMPCLGVYATVTRPGTVHAGDAVRILESPVQR